MRPYIISHMMSSIDGRSLVERWTPPADGIDQKDLRAHYDACAAKLEAQGWMVGRRSMDPFSAGHFRHNEHQAAQQGREDHVVLPAGTSVAVVLDPSGRLAFDTNCVDGDRIVTILGEAVSDSYLAHLRHQGISYIFAGPGGRDLDRGLAALRQKAGIERIMLQGGATVNGAFLEAGLIDEISLIVYPGMDGRTGSPSIFEGRGVADEGSSERPRFRFLACEVLNGGAVWLRYRVERSASPQTSLAAAG